MGGVEKGWVEKGWGWRKGGVEKGWEWSKMTKTGELFCYFCFNDIGNRFVIYILKEKSLASFSHLLFFLVELSNEDVFICK